MKHYSTIVLLLITAFTGYAKPTNDFFANKKYKNSVKDEKCYEKSGTSFVNMKGCTDNISELIQKNIKKKLKQLNKSDNILKTEYKKIKNKCIEKQIKEDDLEDYKYEGGGNYEADFLVAQCIKDNLYQFGRKLK